MKSVYVAGVGLSRFGKDPRSLGEIFFEAAERALAGIDELDALYIGVMNPEEFTGDSNIASLIADAVGLTGVPATRGETASSAGAAALMAGVPSYSLGLLSARLGAARQKNDASQHERDDAHSGRSHRPAGAHVRRDD